MEMNFKEYLNDLAFDTTFANKKEVTLLNWCNIILYTGKVYELKGKMNQKAYETCIDKVKNHKEEWHWIENKILDKIEDYYHNGNNRLYTNFYNDICVGTLNFLTNVMNTCNINNDRLNTLKENFDKLLVSNHVEFVSRKAKGYNNDRKYNERKRALRDSYEEERYN